MNPADDALRSMYGLDPDLYNMAFQFPRLPPAARERIGAPRNAPPRMGDDFLAADFEQFRAAFLERAAALATGSATVPPGHPLSHGRRLLNSVMAENEKLQKENQDLREKLRASGNAQDSS